MAIRALFRIGPAMVIVAAAFGSSLAAEGTPAPGWSGGCEAATRSAPLDCRIEQRAVLAGSGQLVAAVTIRVPGDTRKPLLMIRLPLGLSLAGGVTLDVDGTGARALPLQTCDGSGCYAGAPLPPELLSAMRRGKTLGLVFADLQKNPIRLGLPLDGFAAAYDAVK